MRTAARRRWIAAATLAAFAFGVGCGREERPAEGPKPADAPVREAPPKAPETAADDATRTPPEPAVAAPAAPVAPPGPAAELDAAPGLTPVPSYEAPAGLSSEVPQWPPVAAPAPETPPPSAAARGSADPASRGGPAKSAAPVVRKEEPPYGVQRALCIGINEYEAGPCAGAPLNFAENDARGLAKLLAEGFEFQVTPLVGREATKKNIDAELDRLIAASGPRDVLLVFFAGHGQKVARAAPAASADAKACEGPPPMDGYLLPQDVPLTLENRDTEAVYRAGAVNMRELAARLASDAVKARHVLLVLDCCCSGYALESRGGDSRPGADYVEALASCRTRQVITAGKKDDKSYEFGADAPGDPRHGMFTAVLLELLSREVGNASAQPVLALMPELSQRVFDTVKERLGGRIVPQRRLLVDTGGDYVFIPRDAIEWKDPVRRKVGAAGAGRGAEDVTEAEVKDVADDARSASAGTDLSADPGKSARVDRLEQRAAAGDRRAMEALVYCYRNGVGVPRNEEHAAYWAMQANDLGDARGAFLLAELIQSGNAGVRTQDPAATAALFRACVPPNVADALANTMPWLAASGGGALPETSDAGTVAKVASGIWDWIRMKKPAADPLATLAQVESRLANRPTRWDDVRDDMSDWKQAIDASKDRAAESEADRAIRKLVGDLLYHASRKQRAEASADVTALRVWFSRLGSGAAAK